MNFKTFALSVTSVDTFESVQWQKGTPEISGVDLPVGKKILESLNWRISISLIYSALQESDAPEAYTLTISENNAVITSPTERGLLYGIHTLVRYCDVDQKVSCRILDIPKAEERGLKLYLPPPDENSIAEFFAIIDLALRYKYNFIMLELGGAMEYKSHPEINAAYIEYAGFMNEFPGKAIQIQEQYSWAKNSIHTDNGGGLVLSRELLKKIAAYCDERNLEIIPEVPSLSHCDYLLAAHPELAERKEDPYPDTACPSTPEYYTILFDILEEVIDVFAPRRINIGHDEYYSIALCPECSKKYPPQIYADDINKCSAFLKSHGVKTMIWGEKLLNAHFRSGNPCGGAYNPGIYKPTPIPATHPAVDLVDPDLEILHWYWSIDRDLELEFDKRNRKYLFGNFSPCEIPDWKERSSRKNFSGICVSNWGRSDYETMRRNGIIFDMICGSYLCWNPRIGSENYADLFNSAADELQNLNIKHLPEDAALFAITHTVETPIKFQYFFDGNFIDEKDFHLGRHIFADEDGKEYGFPVVFGKNISNSSIKPARICDPCCEFDRYDLNRQYIEILGGALPERSVDSETWYTVFFPHPAPGKKLIYKKFIQEGKYSCSVKIRIPNTN